MEKNTEKLVYSIAEVAGLLGISKSLAYSLAKEGKLPTAHLGGRIIIPINKFTEYLNNLSD